ncbi:sensor histidine kinase [Lentzea sp. BCCO 10_0856]|uniref:histidine kinase n=1 Tax=Lentzea miocenica TaxID=3095431 RepID=A0ABU4ST37_9PSEU|nr:sensor histidine kinase [Lentzea sp. BCCO 10_0856]MDX8029054.1 sensor histidine kinase [Lentzea sp. BCCO 10_0856]
MKARQFFATGASTLFSADRLVRTPVSPEWRRIRLVLTYGVALWAVFLSVVAPPDLRLDQPSIPGWWLTGLTVAAVLLTLAHPLWAWRLMAVLMVLPPLVLQGLAREWGWPWTPGMVVGAAAVLLVVAQSYRQVVLVWVFIYTMVVVWLHLYDYRDVFLVSAFVTGVLVVGNAMQLRRIAETERNEEHQRRQTEEARAATLAERAVIARELHDVVAHHMSVLALRAGSARYRFADLPPELLTEFTEMQDTAREGLSEMRRLLGVLRNEDGRVETAPQPRVEEIAELVDRLRGAGVAVSLQIEGNVQRVPSGVALSAYRIVQEALSNAVRHAPGSTVDVRIAADSAELRLAVDNGEAAEPPPPPDDRTKHGLLGMRERVATLHGTFRAGPGERGGFVVAVALPLNGNEG